MNKMTKTKLEVNNLRLSFWTNNGTVKAVRDISFTLEDGETLAIVGESGSGKSVTSRAIMGILAGNAIVESGEIFYEGMDLLQISENEYNRLRGNRISMIFQDPLSSLNPIMKIGQQITEAMIANNKSRKKSAEAELNRVENGLRAVAADNGLSAQFEEELRKFNRYLKTGNKYGGEYNDALNSIEMVSKQIRYLLLELKGEISYQDLNSKFTAIKNDAKGIYHELTFAEKDANIAAQFNEVSHLLSEYKQIYGQYEKAAKRYQELDNVENSAKTSAQENNAVKDNYHEIRAKVNNLKEEMSEKLYAVQLQCDEILQRPDYSFLTLGYAVCEHKVSDIHAQYDHDFELQMKQTFEHEFLNDFEAMLQKLLELENVRVKENSAKLIQALDKDLEELNRDFDFKYLSERDKQIDSDVKDTISRLEVRRDSFALTFPYALKRQLNNYTQIQKRKKLKKTKADYISPEEAKTLEKTVQENVIRIFERLSTNLTNKYNTKHDLTAESRELVDYIAEQASDASYTLSQKLAKTRAIDLLDEVGIDNPRRRFEQYPFEFSGGMRQRVVIAIALSSNPDLLICDEPTTALDVTIQAQILDLIKSLKKNRNFSVIFITHDLGVVANIADKIAVMYAGKIVEYGTTDDIFYHPVHPYTWGLLSSMPDLETKEKLVSIPGVPPNMINPPKGDAFAPRNRYALAIDFEEHPPFFKISDTHEAATWLLHEKAPKVEPPKIVTERIERMTKRVHAQELAKARELEKDAAVNSADKSDIQGD